MPVAWSPSVGGTATLARDYNLYHPVAPTVWSEGAQALVPLEPNALELTPDLAADGWHLTGGTGSPLYRQGVGLAAWSPCHRHDFAGAGDARRLRRHPGTPTVGACEPTRESFGGNGAGRVATRSANGRTFHYQYDGEGRLEGATDETDPLPDALVAIESRKPEIEIEAPQFPARAALAESSGAPVAVATARYLHDAQGLRVGLIETSRDADGNPVTRRTRILYDDADAACDLIDLDG